MPQTDAEREYAREYRARTKERRIQHGEGSKK